MIPYNMRYRGPYEYDKFILNTLQYYNEVQNMVDAEISNSDTNFLSITKLQQDVNTIYTILSGDSLNSGMINDIYRELIKYKEGLV